MSLVNLLVKICGVTTAKDAAMAAEMGADAIGVNFWPGSKRYVDPAEAAPILAAIPAGILKVGVFVNESAEEVATPDRSAWGSIACSSTATSRPPTTPASIPRG